MAIINQTNRTLLIEEINPEKLDLITLVALTNSSKSLIRWSTTFLMRTTRR